MVHSVTKLPVVRGVLESCLRIVSKHQQRLISLDCSHVHCQSCSIYLVKTPKRIMKHICMNIMKGMCKDIPFGLPSVLYAIAIRVCLPSDLYNQSTKAKVTTKYFIYHYRDWPKITLMFILLLITRLMYLEWKSSLNQWSILVNLVETKYLFCLKIVHKILSLKSTIFLDNLVLQNSLFKDGRSLRRQYPNNKVYSVS